MTLHSTAVAQPTAASQQRLPRKLSETALVDYYSEAGPDYAAWSKQFNMHFGFYRWGQNPFAREPQLAQMNHEVLDRLALSNPEQLLDMGCGLGATARVAARRWSTATITGITLVPWQRRQAEQMSRRGGANLAARTPFILGDYTAAPFATASFDGAYAIESSCHASGYAKHDFINEAYRLLRPGGRLVIADGFLKHLRPMRMPLARCYRNVCEAWALETFAALPAFVTALERAGFVDITIEDASWRIAPTALHIPLVAVRFLFDELVRKRSVMTTQRWHHVSGPLYGLLLGLCRRRFGYYILSMCKPTKSSF